MKKILVMGGTTFVSKYVAQYFVKKGEEVYVLNRNTKKQIEGVHLIECDRNIIGDKLQGFRFDVVLDINAYTEVDIKNLLDAIGGFDDYIMISSSAVYPETNTQPFNEMQECGPNQIWGTYGIGKLAAEKYLKKNVKNAYIIRPPYLYGEMQNLYREAFIFECADKGRKFYLPNKGDMKLHFFNVDDLCRFIEIIIMKKPIEHIFNVGNYETISVKEWVQLCYEVAGKKNVEYVEVYGIDNQRLYFCFNNYEYELDVELQKKYMNETKSLKQGLIESYKWYKENREEVQKKDYISFIDEIVVRGIE